MQAKDVVDPVRSLLKAVDPKLDEHVWQFRRRQAVRAEGRHLTDLSRHLSGLSVTQSPIHVVVVPHLGPAAQSYKVAGLNYFFEIQQSLREILGEEAVTVIGVDADEPAEEWHRRLLHTLMDTNATHLITQIETDPNKPDEWSWDVIADSLAYGWKGTWMGVMWDAAFPWLRLKARRLGRMFDQLLITDFCQPMSGTARAGRIEAGPVTMPLSQATVDAIVAATSTTPKQYDVTFIGALYDYRVGLLDQLKELGINVVTNPHRSDAPRNYDESRANQPSFLDYMRGLAASETTINFSLASGGPIEQYKIRIQEAAMVGCLPVTDDNERTRGFFAADEFGHFGSVDQLGHTIENLLADRDRLARMQSAAQSRALDLATRDFWGRVSDAARLRGLRAPTQLRTPSGP